MYRHLGRLHEPVRLGPCLDLAACRRDFIGMGRDDGSGFDELIDDVGRFCWTGGVCVTDVHDHELGPVVPADH